MTSLEQMLQDELEKEKQHSSFLLKQLKQSQAEFTNELQKISRLFESELLKITEQFKAELLKNRTLLENYMQTEASEYNALKSDLANSMNELKRM